ncbi:hypothetical protein ACJX0J_013068, partial [Zea mays]
PGGHRRLTFQSLENVLYPFFSFLSSWYMYFRRTACMHNNILIMKHVCAQFSGMYNKTQVMERGQDLTLDRIVLLYIYSAISTCMYNSASTCICVSTCMYTMSFTGLGSAISTCMYPVEDIITKNIKHQEIQSIHKSEYTLSSRSSDA